MRILIALVLTLAVCGCATPTSNYVAKSTDISEPPIGSTNTVNVGDVLLRQGKHKEHDAIYLPAQVDIGHTAYTLYPGYYLKQGDDPSNSYYYPSPGDEGGRIDRNGLVDDWKNVMVRKDETGLCVVTVMNGYICNDTAVLEKRSRPLATQDSFQQALIYSGRVGGKINISYREFSGNKARPAFNNNVEYDLSQSMVIAYKGARLEVVEATNEAIKYKVLRNFDATGQQQ